MAPNAKVGLGCPRRIRTTRRGPPGDVLRGCGRTGITPVRGKREPSSPAHGSREACEGCHGKGGPKRPAGGDASAPAVDNHSDNLQVVRGYVSMFLIDTQPIVSRCL